MSGVIEVNGAPAVVLSARECYLLAAPVRAALAQLHKQAGTRFYVDGTLMAAVNAIMQASDRYDREQMSVMSEQPGNAPDQRDSLVREWWATAEAADFFQCSERTITRWICQGKLIARREGHRWLIASGQSSPTSYAA